MQIIRLMAAFLIGIAFAAPSAAQQRAQAPPPDKVFTSAADVQALIAKAKAERKPDQANFTQAMTLLAPYRANLEYRPLAGAPAIHEKEAEFFYVLEGAGAITVGGTMGKDTITGGTVQKLAKGDFLFVPENTPHQVTSVESTLVFVTLHVPRPAQLP